MKTLIELEIVDNEVKSVKVVTPQQGEGIHSMYARYFDKWSLNWTEDNQHNKIFLKHIQNYANDILKSRGYLFLNEVYDMLGLLRTKVGAIVGWVYDVKNHMGDNYVDLKVINEFDDNSVLLDFNVDGSILDYVEKH